MTRFFCAGLLAFATLSMPVFAEPAACRGQICGTSSYSLTSVDDHVRYGLLVVSAAETLCPAVQFVIADAVGQAVVGRSAVLQPGEVQVVRIGAGFGTGDHALQITASGCPVLPATVRQVRLGKGSPDHGWRSQAFLQMQLTSQASSPRKVLAGSAHFTAW